MTYKSFQFKRMGEHGEIIPVNNRHRLRTPKSFQLIPVRTITLMSFPVDTCTTQHTKIIPLIPILGWGRQNHSSCYRAAVTLISFQLTLARLKTPKIIPIIPVRWDPLYHSNWGSSLLNVARSPFHTSFCHHRKITPINTCLDKY